jgi:osmoprotectant transport system substrate-binding protein
MPVVVGSADFTESKILAEIYSQALKAKNVESSTKLGIGSREIYIKALQDGSITAVPEYTGNLLLNFDTNATATTAEEVEKSLPAVLPPGLKVLKASPAVDQDVYVVTKDFSAQNGITSLEDLKKIASTSTLGGPPELEKRAYGPPGLEKIYGAKFKAFRPYAKYPPKISDLDSNKIQVATFFTTDAVLSEKGYVQLEDPQSMILPQNVIPLVRSDVADNAAAVAALDAVQAALTTQDLMELDKKVDTDHQDPAQVAGDWLKSKGLG